MDASAILGVPMKQFHSFLSQWIFTWNSFPICPNHTESHLIFFGTRNGFHCPKTYNPADFIIGILSRTTTNDKDSNKSTAAQLCDAFEASRHDAPPLQTSTNTAAIEEDQQYDRKKPFWICTVYWMLQRNWLLATRDPTIQNLRIIQKFVSYFTQKKERCFLFLSLIGICLSLFPQTIAIIVGLCFYGTAKVDQTGIQSIQGALFTVIAENFFTPMYSAITVFPKREPLFVRERQAGLYDTFQYYLTTVLALVRLISRYKIIYRKFDSFRSFIIAPQQIPGLIFEPIIFTAIFYFLAGLKPTFYAFAMTASISVIVINISMACGILKFMWNIFWSNFKQPFV